MGASAVPLVTSVCKLRAGDCTVVPLVMLAIALRTGDGEKALPPVTSSCALVLSTSARIASMQAGCRERADESQSATAGRTGVACTSMLVSLESIAAPTASSEIVERRQFTSDVSSACRDLAVDAVSEDEQV